MSSNPRFFDRVLETSTTTGTGTYTLGGAVTGYQSFAVLGDGNSCYYSAFQVDANGNPSGGWEIGVGTYTASGTTLSRDSIQASSNSGAAVSWADGTRRVVLVTPASYFHDGSHTSTSTGDIDDLDFGSAAVIRMNNASLSTIRGLKAGTDGQRVTLLSVGAGQVNLVHQNNGSQAANRLINFTTVGTTCLAAGVGAAELMYDGTTARWRLVSHEQGAAISPTFNASDWTGNNSMTWTVESGDIRSWSYYLRGRTLTVMFRLAGCSVGGTPSTRLQVNLPNGYTGSKEILTTITVQDNGTSQAGLAKVAAGATLLEFAVALSGTGNWQAATNNNGVNGILVIELQ